MHTLLHMGKSKKVYNLNYFEQQPKDFFHLHIMCCMGSSMSTSHTLWSVLLHKAITTGIVSLWACPMYHILSGAVSLIRVVLAHLDYYYWICHVSITNFLSVIANISETDFEHMHTRTWVAPRTQTNATCYSPWVYKHPSVLP